MKERLLNTEGIFLFGFFIFSVYLFLVLYNGSQPFFYDMGIPIIAYLLIGIFLFIGLILVKKNNLIEIGVLKKTNNWFLFSVTILFLVLIFLFNIYNSYTDYPLPISFIQKIGLVDNNSQILSSINSPLFVDCYSSNGERDFVRGETIYCSMKLSYKENFTYHLSQINKIYFYRNDTEEVRSSVMDKDQINKDYSFVQYWNIDIDVDDQFGQVLIELYFSNNSNSPVLTNKYWINPKNILSREEYINKSKDSLSLFLAVISILLFSSISLIKNLMEIYYYKSHDYIPRDNSN